MKNRLQPVFVGFFFLPHLKKLQLVTRTMSKKPDWRFEKNRFRSGCQTGFFRLLQPDFETLPERKGDLKGFLYPARKDR